jgi:hypothetical protein
MTGAGLPHHAGFMSISPHGSEDRGRNPVQIQQNVAGVSAFCIGMDVERRGCGTRPRASRAPLLSIKALCSPLLSARMENTC